MRRGAIRQAASLKVHRIHRLQQDCRAMLALPKGFPYGRDYRALVANGWEPLL